MVSLLHNKFLASWGPFFLFVFPWDLKVGDFKITYAMKDFDPIIFMFFGLNIQCTFSMEEKG